MYPVNQPLINGNEKKLLTDCIDSGWISSNGPYVQEFENTFSNYVECSYGIAVCNGTAALEVALFGAEIGKGDEVIMPSFTIISCAIATIRLGAVPVLVDIEPDTWNMDVGQIQSKITSKTKAIMAVHMYGHPCDMEAIMKIAKKHKLIVIEDASQVHGALANGNKCGGIGDVATFSFYANKIITTGEGGMVTTSNQKIAERARSYRNLCFKSERRFYHTELGENFRMTNMQAALGVAQMERIDEFVGLKRKIGFKYLEELNKIKGVKAQIEKPDMKMVFWMYAIELSPDLNLDAKTVMAALAERKIGTRPFFLGLHEQPALHDRGLFKNEKYPITDRAYKQGLYLPSSLTLKDNDVEWIASQLHEIIHAS
jgi:perosamine synthetase